MNNLADNCRIEVDNDHDVHLVVSNLGHLIYGNPAHNAYFCLFPHNNDYHLCLCRRRICHILATAVVMIYEVTVCQEADADWASGTSNGTVNLNENYIRDRFL